MMHLTSSAVMPKAGIYECRLIRQDYFHLLINRAFLHGTIKNYISYPQNLELIAEKTGISFPANRDRIQLKPGDIILAMTLKYRPEKKGDVVNEEDFSYYYIKYVSR